MAAAEASRRSPDSADLVVICTLNGEGRGGASLARAWRAVFARGGVGLGGAAPARRGPARAGAEWGALVGWRAVGSTHSGRGSRAAGGARLVAPVCVTGSKVKAVRALRRSGLALAAGLGSSPSAGRWKMVGVPRWQASFANGDGMEAAMWAAAAAAASRRRSSERCRKRAERAETFGPISALRWSSSHCSSSSGCHADGCAKGGEPGPASPRLSVGAAVSAASCGDGAISSTISSGVSSGASSGASSGHRARCTNTPSVVAGLGSFDGRDVGWIHEPPEPPADEVGADGGGEGGGGEEGGGGGES